MSHRYFVLNGYKHISKKNAYIVTNVFNQISFNVSQETWKKVIGSDLPYIRNDVRISEEELKNLIAEKF